MTKTAKERNLRFAGRSIESKKEERKRYTLIAMHSNRIFGEERKEEKKKKISHAIHKNRGKQYQ